MKAPIITVVLACAMLAACNEAKVDQQAEALGNGVTAAGKDVAEAGAEITEAVNSAAADVVEEIDGVKRPTDAWIGKWTGVEGLALDIRPGDAEGSYKLHLAVLDGAADYTGTADGGAIRFTRDGKEEEIRKATGAETGLKWLADKKDCLVIKPGEGFCRG